jgi:hypothetical protein
LWINREALEPYFDLRMLRHLKPVVQLCTLFSRKQNPLTLVDMMDLLDEVFAEFPVRDDRDLLISCEGLAGHLPGWPNVRDYSAVPTLWPILQAISPIVFQTRKSKFSSRRARQMNGSIVHIATICAASA